MIFWKTSMPKCATERFKLTCSWSFAGCILIPYNSTFRAISRRFKSASLGNWPLKKKIKTNIFFEFIRLTDDFYENSLFEFRVHKFDEENIFYYLNNLDYYYTFLNNRRFRLERYMMLKEPLYCHYREEFPKLDHVWFVMQKDNWKINKKNIITRLKQRWELYRVNSSSNCPGSGV